MHRVEHVMGFPVSLRVDDEHVGEQTADAVFAWLREVDARFSPFKADTEYFNPSTRDFMFNLMVDDLEGVLAMVREAGGQVVGESDHQPYGSFNWIIDPDGNKIELWQPKEMPAE